MTISPSHLLTLCVCPLQLMRRSTRKLKATVARIRDGSVEEEEDSIPMDEMGKCLLYSVVPSTFTIFVKLILFFPPVPDSLFVSTWIPIINRHPVLQINHVVCIQIHWWSGDEILIRTLVNPFLTTFFPRSHLWFNHPEFLCDYFFYFVSVDC